MKKPAHAHALAAAAAALAAPLFAHAHHAMDSALPGSLFEGLISGLAHPVIGLDHFLFVLAIGAACCLSGGRIAAAALFVAATVAGTVLHLYTASIAYPDVWVAASLVALGIAFFGGRRFMRSRWAFALFALAGIAHGYAYGEAIVGAEATPLLAYLVGFALVQVAVIAGAYAATRALSVRLPGAPGASVLGGALSLAGVAFLALALG